MEEELTPQAKAAKATLYLLVRGSVPTRELMEVTGMHSPAGISFLMGNLSQAHIPVIQPEHGHWAVLEEWRQDILRSVESRSGTGRLLDLE